MKEKKLADGYLKHGNGTRAALASYNTTSEPVAASIASEVLRREKVLAYIAGCAEKAASNVFKLANTAKNENVRLSANRDILDRAGLQAASRSESVSIVEHHHSGGIVIAQLAEKVSSELANRKLRQDD